MIYGPAFETTEDILESVLSTINDLAELVEDLVKSVNKSERNIKHMARRIEDLEGKNR